MGLSPRARGNPLIKSFVDTGRGPIPASAGEPLLRFSHHFFLRAYPRERGGTDFENIFPFPQKGLSPRARGNRTRRGASLGGCGPIPASAGEPRPHPPRMGSPRAYPRERGGTRAVLMHPGRYSGLSPRARGNPAEAEKIQEYVRPIPASAGEPQDHSSKFLLHGAYPRERGGTRRVSWIHQIERGLSPRARGNLARR